MAKPMKNLQKIIIGCICLTLFSVECFGQATIIPRLLEVKVTRGGQAKFMVKIGNRGSTPAYFKLYVVDMEVDEEGVPFPKRTLSDSSCTRWVMVDADEFRLEPDESRMVNGLVKAPRDAVGGYGAILYGEYTMGTEGISGDVDGKSFKLQLGRAVATTLIITIVSSQNVVDLVPDTLIFLPTASEQASIFDPLSSSRTTWEVKFPVVNTGNAVTIAQGELSIWDTNARLIEKVDLKAGKGYIFPGKRRMFHAKGQKHLANGSYLIKTNLFCREGKRYSGVYPFHIIDERVVTGEIDDKIEALLAAAQPGFNLSHHYLEFNIEPSSKRTRGLHLSNLRDDSLTVQAHYRAWELAESGQINLTNDTGSAYNGCSDWVTLEPNPITIPPGGRKSVKITLNAPTEMSGEYYSAIIFTPEGVSQDLPEELELDRALLIAASSKRSLNYQAEFASIEIEPVNSMMRYFTVEVQNAGNTRCYVNGELVVLDELGRSVGPGVRFGGEGEYAFPGSKRTFKIPYEKELEPGKYRAHITVEYNTDENPIDSELPFMMN